MKESIRRDWKLWVQLLTLHVIFVAIMYIPQLTPYTLAYQLKGHPVWLAAISVLLALLMLWYFVLPFLLLARTWRRKRAKALRGYGIFGLCYAILWVLLFLGVLQFVSAPSVNPALSIVAAVVCPTALNLLFPVAHLFQYLSELPLFQGLSAAGTFFWFVSPAVLVGLGLFIAELTGFFRLRARKSPQMPNNV